MDDLVTDIDGRAVFLERPFDDINGPLNPGAEAARLGENHLYFFMI
jgi:hypothetical protein